MMQIIIERSDPYRALIRWRPEVTPNLYNLDVSELEFYGAFFDLFLRTPEHPQWQTRPGCLISCHRYESERYIQAYIKTKGEESIFEICRKADRVKSWLNDSLAEFARQLSFLHSVLKRRLVPTPELQEKKEDV